MRCDAHDLAVGPDGRCALCRREGAVDDGPVFFWAVGVIGLLLLMGVTYRAVTWTAAVLSADKHAAASVRTSDDAAPDSRGTPRIIVYTTNWCPTCKLAKKWLTAEGIPFEEHDVEASREDARKMHSLNPRGSVPTFDIDGQVVVGFSEPGLRGAIAGATAKRGSRAL